MAMLLLLLRNRQTIAWILLALSLIVGYMWVRNLVSTNHRLKVEASQALEDADAARVTLEQYQRDLQTNELVKQRARQEADRLDALERNHDLAPLARAKPGLVEDRINRGTDRARCMLEHATGGPACP